ncbi:xyloglucan galactosyltransferase MUR3 [Tanacetum coccineum]
MNNRLGPVLDNTEGVFSNNGWYATEQFSVEVIFTYRLKQYECLTNESSLASAIFVPFYAGLDATRGYNISVRDAASIELVEWLQKRDEWKYMNGKDHFLVGGRTTWDFRRSVDEDYEYGTKLLLLPAVKNMSILFLESSPWNSNEFAVPYPSYFHPSKDVQVFHWQDQMRTMERKWWQLPIGVLDYWPEIVGGTLAMGAGARVYWKVVWSTGSGLGITGVIVEEAIAYQSKKKMHDL